MVRLWLCAVPMLLDGKPRPSGFTSPSSFLPFQGKVMYQDMSIPSISWLFLYVWGSPLLLQYSFYCCLSYLTPALLHVSLLLHVHIHILPSSFLNDILNSKITMDTQPSIPNKIYFCSFD